MGSLSEVETNQITDRSTSDADDDESGSLAVKQQGTKVVRKKKIQKSKLHSFIQFDVVPSCHSIRLGNNESHNNANYDDCDECYDYDLLLDEEYDPMEISNNKRGGKPVRSTSCNKKPRVQKGKLIRFHEETKEMKRAERIKDNYTHRKSNIERVLLINGRKRFGYDIYKRRCESVSVHKHKPAASATYRNVYCNNPAAIDAPSVRKHELKKTNVPKEHGFLLQLVDLQHRELTPEDFELLLLLDDTVAPKHVDPELLKSFEELSPALARLVGEICSICMESFELDQKAKVLPCKHYFHSKCIDNWLSCSSQKCPLDGLAVFPS